MRFFDREVARRAIEVHLDHPFTAGDARRLRPHAIILATGAESRTPDIPGVDLPHVVAGWRIIAGLAETGRNCVVIRGGLVGMEVADYLAHRGKRALIVARSDLVKKACPARRFKSSFLSAAPVARRRRQEAEVAAPRERDRPPGTSRARSPGAVAPHSERAVLSNPLARGFRRPADTRATCDVLGGEARARPVRDERPW